MKAEVAALVSDSAEIGQGNCTLVDVSLLVELDHC